MVAASFGEYGRAGICVRETVEVVTALIVVICRRVYLASI
jgi:hypothetical protein